MPGPVIHMAWKLKTVPLQLAVLEVELGGGHHQLLMTFEQEEGVHMHAAVMNLLGTGVEARQADYQLWAVLLGEP